MIESSIDIIAEFFYGRGKTCVSDATGTAVRDFIIALSAPEKTRTADELTVVKRSKDIFERTVKATVSDIEDFYLLCGIGAVFSYTYDFTFSGFSLTEDDIAGLVNAVAEKLVYTLKPDGIVISFYRQTEVLNPAACFSPVFTCGILLALPLLGYDETLIIGKNFNSAPVRFTFGCLERKNIKTVNANAEIIIRTAVKK